MQTASVPRVQLAQVAIDQWNLDHDAQQLLHYLIFAEFQSAYETASVSFETRLRGD